MPSMKSNEVTSKLNKMYKDADDVRDLKDGLYRLLGDLKVSKQISNAEAHGVNRLITRAIRTDGNVSQDEWNKVVGYVLNNAFDNNDKA